MPKRKANARKPREFVFKMDVAYSLETLPMNRLAEYMSDIAIILGERKNVHFVSLKGGSVALNIIVDHEAEPKVRNRIRLTKSDDGPPEARNAIRDINRRLAEDDASGVLLDPDEKRIIPFPGKKRFAQPAIGPIRQPGSLDGIPIVVGGRKDPVPVHLEGFGKEIYICMARRGIAQEIAKYMFETPIRVDGTGSWLRHPDGEWEMRSFTIHDFQEVEEVSLNETVQRLRAIKLPIETGENLLETMSEIRDGS